MIKIPCDVLLKINQVSDIEHPVWIVTISDQNAPFATVRRFRNQQTQLAGFQQLARLPPNVDLVITD